MDPRMEHRVMREENGQKHVYFMNKVGTENQDVEWNWDGKDVKYNWDGCVLSENWHSIRMLEMVWN